MVADRGGRAGEAPGFLENRTAPECARGALQQVQLLCTWSLALSLTSVRGDVPAPR